MAIGLEIGSVAKSVEHFLDTGERIDGMTVTQVGILDLDHQRAIAQMDAGIDGAVGDDPQQRIQQVTRAREAGALQQLAKPLKLLGIQHVRQVLPGQRRRIPAEQAECVACDLLDQHRCRIDHEHRTMGEDRAGNMDRLAIAVGQIDGTVHLLRHAGIHSSCRHPFLIRREHRHRLCRCSRSVLHGNIG